ncbi:zinc finger MYM-type protein 1-like isoform X1 [Sipha flava]|uniref:Zinc finger MYM-type protein 1-like isoform X1 n=1 Tax=Sipha flava TaxID=143950 RepID=A0A8B8G0J7_9HEMI|nr:zinc finger MYM-type protein 1-like isoform X1 [Sipha flava]
MMNLKLSSNKGNFKETCDLLAKNCPEFEEKYSNLTNFTSHLIQDELVNLSAESIRSKITKEIKCNKVFGIMIDEARCFKEEQMSVCVRYTVGLNVVERFLGFVDVSENQNADSLCAKIFEFLTENQLDKYHIVAQSYDGASVMSGKFNGVQSKVKNKFPYAIYTHCMAHRMNIVVIDMCKIVKESRIVFNTIESLYKHFSHPTKNKTLVTMHRKLGVKISKINSLSDTRWNCRWKNCESVVYNY